MRFLWLTIFASASAWATHPPPASRNERRARALVHNLRIRAVPDGLSAWLWANEQRTARVAPPQRILEQQPDYGEAGLVTRRPIG